MIISIFETKTEFINILYFNLFLHNLNNKILITKRWPTYECYQNCSNQDDTLCFMQKTNNVRTMLESILVLGITYLWDSINCK